MVTNHAEPATLSAETVERLAGLGRLWGVVKYFHPALASGAIDWDGALAAAVPPVVAAASAQEYRRALDGLLAALADPVTRTLPESGSDGMATSGSATVPATAPAAAPQPYLHQRADGIAVVVADDPAQLAPSDRNLDAAFREVFAAAEGAPGLVVDLRGLDGEASWSAEWAVLSGLPLLLAEPLPTAGFRHRMHAGHRQQRGPVHGGYYSAVVHQPGDVIPPSERGRRQPLAVVLRGASPDLYRVLGGMQAAGLAVVVHEGDPGSGVGTDAHELTLPDGITARVRVSEFVSPDGLLGFRPDAVVPGPGEAGWTAERAVAAAVAAVAADRAPRPVPPPAPPPAALFERDYREMTAPKPPYRLLALFRFWNAIHYLFPYKHLLDHPWDGVLAEFVPRFARAGDARDYALAVAHLATRIQDTHGHVQCDALREEFGSHAPALAVRVIEGETVVIRRDAAAGIEVGDVVVAVDGETTASRRARLGEFLAASTPQALRWQVDGVLLAGAEGSGVALTVRGGDGADREVVLGRTRLRWEDRGSTTLPVFGLLPEGFGYVDLTRLTVPQVDEAFSTVGTAPGLIFDMRGYPNDTAWAIAPWLTDVEVVTARFVVPELHSPDLESAGSRRFRQTAVPREGARYRGAVVVADRRAGDQPIRAHLPLPGSKRRRHLRRQPDQRRQRQRHQRGPARRDRRLLHGHGGAARGRPPTAAARHPTPRAGRADHRGHPRRPRRGPGGGGGVAARADGVIVRSRRYVVNRGAGSRPSPSSG